MINPYQFRECGHLRLARGLHMNAISIIGSGGMAAAIGGLAARAGHTSR